MRTTRVFPNLSQTCELSLLGMRFIENELTKIAKEKSKVFSPSQAFVTSYFRRNTSYLQSAYIIGAMSFFGPSINNQRTVYEAILRGYLFIVNPDEANKYHDNLAPEKVENFLRSRNYYSHKWLCEELFDLKRQKQQRRFYGVLCESAHAEIKGLFLDFPRYNEKQIEDALKIILMLSYGNIQMVSEMFLSSFNNILKNIVRDILKGIMASVGNQIPLFEPNKKGFDSKIKLKKGNFLEVLK
jgi:hypothetical protein